MPGRPGHVHDEANLVHCSLSVAICTGKHGRSNWKDSTFEQYHSVLELRMALPTTAGVNCDIRPSVKSGQCLLLMA